MEDGQGIEQGLTMSKKRTKKQMSKTGKMSRNKGRRGEQAWVKRLNSLLPFHAPFARDWLRSRQKQSRGDLVSTQESMISDFYVEVKHRGNITNKNIRTWFHKARKQADKINRCHVLLCIHQDRGPWLIFTDSLESDRSIIWITAETIVIRNWLG